MAGWNAGDVLRSLGPAILLVLGCADETTVEPCCGDESVDPTDGGDDAHAACPSPDETLLVDVAFAPCIDAACSDTDTSQWHAPPNADQPVSLDVDLSCTVALEPGVDSGRVHLVECSGNLDTPFGVLVRIVGAANRLALDAGAEVRVAHRWAHDGWYSETSFGTLRSESGDLVALFTDNGLPFDAFASPLIFRGQPIDCEPLYKECGGVTHLGEVQVSLGADSASIPAHRGEHIGADPTYAVAVHEAEVGQGYLCGYYGSWSDFSVAAMAERPAR
jgi:hypothetical protein